MGISDWVSFSLSFLAVLIALYAAWTSRKTQRRQIQIEEERDRVRYEQQNKANLVARIEGKKSPRGSSQHPLVIENKGSTEARNVNFTLDGKPFQKHPTYLEGQVAEDFLIGPNSSVKFQLGINFGQALPFQIEIQWTDDSGIPRVYRSTLTL